MLVWVLIWMALLGVCGWWLWRRLQRFWSRLSALGKQVADAELLVQALELAVAERQQAAAAAQAGMPAEPLAIFRDPLAVAAERAHLRETLSQERQERRRARRPGWARRLDSST